MKRFVFLGASFGIVVLMVLLVGGSAIGGAAKANSLPEVEFLGEGPGSFNTTLDNFIVKRGQEQYDFESGSAYEAASGERVWAVRGANGAPPAVYNGVVDLGWAYEGCTVEYVGIDDDVNGIRNGFFLGSNLLEVVKEGMVFEGSYVIPVTARDHRFVAEESVAGWYTPCEEGAEPTPTETVEPPEETPTATTEPPGDDTIIFFPLVMYVGDGQPPPTATPSATATAEPSSFTLSCDQEYEINIVDEEMHFKFAATAYEDGVPLEGVDLRGTLDTGSQTPSNIENTNFNGVADFTITVLITSVEQTPVATVIFNEQGTYGNASCTVDFSTELPTPTPDPPPSAEFDLVCDQNYDVRFNDEDVEFKFAATAFFNGYPLPDVDLKAELDTGSGLPRDSVEETNFNGVADFKIEVLITNINKTPIATISFDDQSEFGDAFCIINSSESNLDWSSIINR